MKDSPRVDLLDEGLEAGCVVNEIHFCALNRVGVDCLKPILVAPSSECFQGCAASGD